MENQKKAKAEITLKIGKILALYLIVTGGGFLLSPGFFASLIVKEGSDPVLINLSGMVHFFIGVTILVNHFLWKGLHQILVSVVGVLFFLKGLFLIALPELTLQSGNNELQVPMLMGFGFVGLGFLLGFLSFRKTRVEEKARMV